MGSSSNIQYRVKTSIDLYDSSNLNRLATQAAKGRYLCVTAGSRSAALSGGQAVQVQLCEDDYPGWLNKSDLQAIEPATAPYQPAQVSDIEVQQRIPHVIAFTRLAMAEPNHYLWGGTVGPHYDCSGLMQAAFAASGIWLPRDAYQQEAFTQTVQVGDLRPGDLIFFGPPEKATHVGLFLGGRQYIHSSGKDQGRNGIGIDELSLDGDEVSQRYYAQLRGAGRVVSSYQPQGCGGE
jgi:cell wall-associated NlpC family hydrolase